jgi:transcriptional regulator GlxA family with amidase domain
LEFRHDRAMAGAASPRQVAILVYPGVQSLDVTGPLEVFAGARELIESGARGGRSYEVRTFARDNGPLRTSSGLAITPDARLSDAPEDIDTLIVPGGHGATRAVADAVLLDWIAQAAARARRTVAVCTGAFLLAEAGLLAGRRATTHWAAAEELGRMYPDVEVDPDPIFLRDGHIWTSAGVTAGMDLALALVEDDHGREVARTVAQELVLFLRRPGSQSQFSVPLWSAQPRTDPIRAALSAIHSDPGARHGIADLAIHAGLSTRHLQRRFTAELGTPPAAYVERVRIEAARRALAGSDDPVEVIARRCGFGTAETLRRAFHRTTRVAPSDYRNRFRTAAELS